MLITDKNELLKFGTDFRVWQGIPGIERTAKGRLFATFYSGGMRESIENFCILVKSDDDGESWSEPIAISGGEELFRFFDPCIWIDPEDRLWFTYAKGPDKGVFGVICDDPDAEDLVWGDEFFIGRDVMMNKPTVLSTGEWLFPVAMWNETTLVLPSAHSGDRSDNGIWVYKSTDKGKTFTKSGRASAPLRSYDEHMIAELNSGILLMTTRTANGTFKTYSYDGGKTWSRATAFDIATPSSRVFLRKLSSGRLLCIVNDDPKKRTNMTAYLSDNNGNSWDYKLLLDERESVSYPDAKEGNNGFIYITYDRERGSFEPGLSEAENRAREILMCKITEQDILEGRIVSEGSRLKSIISKLGKYKGETDYYAGIKNYSEDAFVEHLKTLESPEQMIDTIFSYYSPNCEIIEKTDTEALDKALNSLKDGSDIESGIRKVIGLLNGKHLKPQATNPLTQRITEYVDSHIAEDFSLDGLSEKLSASRYYLCHVFKSNTGISILEYRNAKRISMAKKLLFDTDKTISEIAQICGFGDSSSFIRIFKESEHITPTDYRNKYRSIV